MQLCNHFTWRPGTNEEQMKNELDLRSDSLLHSSCNIALLLAALWWHDKVIVVWWQWIWGCWDVRDALRMKSRLFSTHAPPKQIPLLHCVDLESTRVFQPIRSSENLEILYYTYAHSVEQWDLFRGDSRNLGEKGISPVSHDTKDRKWGDLIATLWWEDDDKI